MKVLVTGAGGFIGSHLIERLVREGRDVRAFVRYNSRQDLGLLALLPADVRAAVEVIAGDLRDADAVRAAWLMIARSLSSRRADRHPLLLPTSARGG